MMQPDDNVKYIISGVAGSTHSTGLGWAVFRNAPMPSPTGSAIRQGTLFQIDVMFSRSKGFVPIEDALLDPGDNVFHTPEEAALALLLMLKPLDIKQACKWCGVTPGQVNDGAGLCKKNSAGLGAKGWGLSHEMVILCPSLPEGIGDKLDGPWFGGLASAVLDTPHAKGTPSIRVDGIDVALGGAGVQLNIPGVGAIEMTGQEAANLAHALNLVCSDRASRAIVVGKEGVEVQR